MGKSKTEKSNGSNKNGAGSSYKLQYLHRNMKKKKNKEKLSCESESPAFSLLWKQQKLMNLFRVRHAHQRHTKVLSSNFYVILGSGRDMSLI